MIGLIGEGLLGLLGVGEVDARYKNNSILPVGAIPDSPGTRDFMLPLNELSTANLF
jgi:hypothetical protein